MNSEPRPSRTPAQPVLAAIVLVLATGAGVIASSASAEATRAGTCLASPELPCSASEGQTYGATTLADGGDSEGPLEAVLAHVESEPTDVTPVAQGLTGDSDEFDLTFRDANDERFEHFSWSYSGEGSLAYLTVASEEGGFAIYDISQETEGSVDTPRLLGGERVTHVSFWQRTSVECTPVRVADAHGKGIIPNCQLSKINRRGKVLCVHVETGKNAKCMFRTGEDRSGRWLEGVKRGKKADYAMAGQALSRKGKRGGRFVVASRMTQDGEVPCRKPKPQSAARNSNASKRDTASPSADTNLAGYGIQETPASTTNAGGMPLANYATREVCTNTPTHPDGARLSSHAPGSSVWCFTGTGAGLNDPYGQERDSEGWYFSTPYRYPANHPHAWPHKVVYNNSVVPAAKRPATRPDGTIINSPIAWRPVAPNAKIAN